MSEAIKNAKAQIVSEFADKIASAKSFVLVDYRGLTVEEDTNLRNALRKENVEYRVVKNRLILRAVEKAGIEGIEASVCEGPTAVALSYEDAVAPAKLLTENAKKVNKTAIKGGVVEGKVCSVEELAKVATIPAKPVLIAQLLGMMQSPVRSLAVVLSEIAKKQEA